VIDTPLAELRCHLLCRLAMQDGYMDAELQLVLAIDDHLLTRRKAGIDERLPVASTVTSRIQYIRGGMLRALAVTTAKRQEPLPDVPTVGEFLPGFEARGWYGIVVPKATPTEIVEKLNKEINAALADPNMKKRLTDLGAAVFAGSPADFGKFIADEIEKWRKVVRFAGIKAE
jgi:tripartite-type tricarboxylate transporter receptor subunit TctC